MIINRLIFPLRLAGDIEQLKRQQSVILALTIVILVLFVLVHGTRLLRWLHRKDYISFSAIRGGGMSKKKQQIHPSEITVANPHTQSPKLSSRRSNGNAAPGITMSTAYSISGESPSILSP